MNKDFVPYEEALALKELEFDEPCFAVYSEHDKTRVYEESSIVEGLKIQAPLYQQAFRWFREKYGYYYPIHRTTNNTNQVLYSIGPYAGDYFTYEEAELACLKKLIENSKK
jgi:hypothetical protein